MTERITITIPNDPDKPVRIEVDGVTGPSCKDLTRQLEAAFGAPETTQEKPEYNEVQRNQKGNQQQVGGF